MTWWPWRLTPAVDSLPLPADPELAFRERLLAVERDARAALEAERVRYDAMVERLTTKMYRLQRLGFVEARHLSEPADLPRDEGKEAVDQVVMEIANSTMDPAAAFRRLNRVVAVEMNRTQRKSDEEIIALLRRGSTNFGDDDD